MILLFFVVVVTMFVLPPSLDEQIRDELEEVRLLLDNAVVLVDKSLEETISVYNAVRARVTHLCDECFAEATDFNQRRRCDETCKIGEPTTLEQMSIVFKDVRARLQDECVSCFTDDLHPSLNCRPCEALAYPPVEDDEWSLSLRIWLGSMSRETKTEMANFIARDLFLTDNTFFRVSQRRCVDATNYCLSTYGFDGFDYEKFCDDGTRKILDRMRGMGNNNRKSSTSEPQELTRVSETSSSVAIDDPLSSMRKEILLALQLDHVKKESSSSSSSSVKRVATFSTLVLIGVSVFIRTL